MLEVDKGSRESSAQPSPLITVQCCFAIVAIYGSTLPTFPLVCSGYLFWRPLLLGSENPGVDQPDGHRYWLAALATRAPRLCSERRPDLCLQRPWSRRCKFRASRASMKRIAWHIRCTLAACSLCVRSLRQTELSFSARFNE